MTAEHRRLIQILLAIAMVAAAVRLALIYGERHHAEEEKEKAQPQQSAAPPSSYYVVPRKLHAYDLKSAQELTKQPVWMKEGYRFTFYPHNGRTDFKHPAGVLGPLEKLQISKVARERGPSAEYPPQVMAVFRKEGKSYAVPIGQMVGEDYRIFADDMFLLQDPHRLYDWPAEEWQAIDAHRVKPGMDEIQASFALGMGIPQPSDDPDSKTVVYPNGGDQVVITFRHGRAVDVKSSSQQENR